MPLKGVVFNRVHTEFPADPALFPAETVTRADEPVVTEQLRAIGVAAAHLPWLASNFVDYQLLARGEALRMDEFRRGIPRRVPFVTVPNFDSDVHDLTGLTRMHQYLFAPVPRAEPSKPRASTPKSRPARLRTPSPRSRGVRH
jgi:hypothetical protein